MRKLPELTPLRATISQRIYGLSVGEYRGLSTRMHNEFKVFALDDVDTARVYESDFWSGRVWNGNYEITKDSQVMSLAGYQSVTGNLVIKSKHVTCLDHLESLNHVGGDLIIKDTLVQDMDGFANLVSVGENVKIEANSALRLLDNFGGFIRTVEDSVVGRRFWTLREAKDGNFGGFSKLQSVGGDFTIGDNSALKSLRGLESLRSINGSLSIWVNDSLEDLSGLSSLRTVGGHLEIWGNASLPDLYGMGSLVTVGGDFSLGIGDFGNDSLVDLDGLSSLKTVRGDVTIRSNGSLENIDGLCGVGDLVGKLQIVNNGSLTDLDGLANLSKFNGPSIQISNNDNLPLNDVLDFHRRLVSKGSAEGFAVETYLSFNKHQ